MDAEKFELLEARIRETALLVTRLREENQRVEDENAQLRAYAEELEVALRQAQQWLRDGNVETLGLAEWCEQRYQASGRRGVRATPRSWSPGREQARSRGRSAR